MATNRKKLTSTLAQFYDRPVAKVSLELFLSLGAIIFFAIFAIRPTLLTMSELVKEIEDKEQLDQQLKQKIAALETLQTTYITLEPRLGVLDDAIPSQPNFEDVLKIIEKTASENQLIITDIQVQEIPQNQDEELPFSQLERVTVPMTTSVIGDYNSIRNFIEALHQTRRALFVDSIIFAVVEERGNNKLRATVTINMSYYAPKKSKSAAKGSP